MTTNQTNSPLNSWKRANPDWMRDARDHITTMLIAMVCLGTALIAPRSRAETEILLKPTASWSVTGQDDVQQLKRLAAGVGWEFEPNAATTSGLKKIGIKTIRCIIADPLPGHFNKEGEFIIVGKPDRLLDQLATC